jgi:nicotinamidase-related amidase
MTRLPYNMLSAPAPPFQLGAENSALLLIDPQRFTTLPDTGLASVAQERGIIRELDEYYSQAEAAIGNMARLLAACRGHYIRTIYTVLNSERSDRSDLSRQLRVIRLPTPVGKAGAEIRQKVAPMPEDLILPRGTYSPFTSTNLLAHLLNEGIDTIVLAGMLANISVAMTAREAADRDFDVIFVWDASASETIERHAQIKSELVGGLVRVRSTQEVIEILQGTRT